MLAEGGKAHDGENAPHRGAVQVAASAQDKGDADEAVDSHVDQHRAGAEHAQIVAGGPPAGEQQAAVSSPGGPGRPSGAQQPQEKKHGAEDPQGQPQGEIISLGPVVPGGWRGPHGADQRNQDKGQQTAGKAHIIQVHAVLDLVGVGGERGQDKADQHPHQTAQQGGAPAVVQCNVADDRSQGGGEQAGGDILSEGFPPELGVEPGAQQDGPDVDDIFAEQGEAGHEPHHHQGEAVERLVGEAQHHQGDGGHQGGVDQRVLGENNGRQTGEDLIQRAQKKTEQGQGGGVDPEQRIHPVIPHGVRMVAHRGISFPLCQGMGSGGTAWK